MEVRFWERLREERKFGGPEELRSQIAIDLERAREFFRQLDLSQTCATARLILGRDLLVGRRLRTSGAKAPFACGFLLSELKLRPP